MCITVCCCACFLFCYFAVLFSHDTAADTVMKPCVLSDSKLYEFLIDIQTKRKLMWLLFDILVDLVFQFFKILFVCSVLL